MVEGFPAKPKRRGMLDLSVPLRCFVKYIMEVEYEKGKTAQRKESKGKKAIL